jgi:serine-type D-Ala-D-Ala carboxypeptidase/endopeptidase
MHRLSDWLTAVATVLFSLPAWSLSSEALQARLDARFKGDRTGVCVVAAVIEKGQVVRGRTCAQPRTGGAPGDDSRFEIGSVTKTMTAFLVAELIRQGQWSLDDPIARHLPPDTVVPRQGARQILVRDLLTHTSGLPGLPPGFRPSNPSDPYADLDERTLLAALGKVQLNRRIGSQFEYSNFAMMVVSAAVARSLGGDYEQALIKHLFAPLQMHGAFISQPRSAAPVAQGHLPSGAPAAAWHAATNLAGVGMVRASLDDMVKYAQAQLGQGEDLPPALRASLRLTQQPLREGWGMNWMRAKVQGHELVAHEGGTGGFSSLVALEPTAQRAVVILADTSLTDLGGLGRLGNALLDIDEAPLRPRLAATPSAALLAAMPGEFEMGGLRVRLWLEDGKRLMAQAEGQAAFELRHDSEGDFYPDSFGALLTPLPENGKVDRAVWRQGGGAVELRRIAAQTRPTASDPRWKDFAGEYALLPQFSLRVFEEAGVLKVQGSGQPAIAAELVGTDTIEIKAVGALVEFRRDAAGQVTSAVLKQGGQVLQGQRK